MSREKSHRKDDKKEKFRTPPLTQQPQFSHQSPQYYYYYQTPVYPSGMVLSPHASPNYHPDANLMSPPHYNYSPASPSQKYAANKPNQSYSNYGQPMYTYPYSPKSNYNMHYSPKKYGNGRSNDKQNQGWTTSPKKQGTNKTPKLKQAYPWSPSDRNNKQGSSPSKYNNRGGKLNDNKQSKMTPLTSNTNIRKDFVKQELKSFAEYKGKLERHEEITRNAENHEYVTEINTKNCLEKKSLHLLKKPVYDVLYELDMDKFCNLGDEQEKDKMREVDNEFDNLILGEIKNNLELDIDSFFENLSNVLQRSNEENDISALDASESSINKSMSSGRMIVLKKDTNLFVSSKGKDPNSSINADRRISYSSKNENNHKTRDLRRTLNLGTSGLNNRDLGKSSSQLLFGDIGDSSFIKSNKSNNFNKLIETSPKKLALNQRTSTEASPTKKSRSLVSKGASLLRAKNEEELESLDEADRSQSVYIGSGLGLLRQPSVIDYSETESHTDKAMAPGNASILDLSFDGKAMNKSDLFKLIDSFEM